VSVKKEEIIKNLPQKIGVYKFLDHTNKIIYVGKAKNLRKRVGSYFSTKTSGKTLRLVNKIDDVKYILVQNELDALLLENNLIKKYQPKYNVLMKDDKSYPWIKITKENFPKILFTRKVVNDGSDYFGPYKSTYVINVLIDLFYDMFYDSGWTPITLLKNKVNSQKNEKYQEIIKKIKSILKGNLKTLINQLSIKMEKQSELLNFEEAKKIKSKIDLLKDYRSKSIIGEKAEVLVEGKSSKFENMVTGRTTNNKIINIPGQDNLVGELLKIQITELNNKSLKGEILISEY